MLENQSRSLRHHRVGVGDPAVDPAEPPVDLRRGRPEVDPRPLDTDPPDVGGMLRTGQSGREVARRPRATPARAWPSAGPRGGFRFPRGRTGSRASDRAPGGSPWPSARIGRPIPLERVHRLIERPVRRELARVWRRQNVVLLRNPPTHRADAMCHGALCCQPFGARRSRLACPRHAKSAECEARAEAARAASSMHSSGYGHRDGTSGIRRPRPLGTRVVPVLRDRDRGRGVVCQVVAHHPVLRVLDHPGPGPPGPSRPDGPASPNAVNRHLRARRSGSISRGTVGRPLTRRLRGRLRETSPAAADPARPLGMQPRHGAAADLAALRSRPPRPRRRCSDPGGPPV